MEKPVMKSLFIKNRAAILLKMESNREAFVNFAKFYYRMAPLNGIKKQKNQEIKTI